MSTEADMDSLPKTKKTKDKARDGSSKKWRRERDEVSSTTPAKATSSPSKKRRKDGKSSSSSVQKKHSSSQAVTKQTTSTSPLGEQTISFYLPLSPIANHFAIQGLCAEHISPLLLTYYPPLKGFLLSYTNPRLSETAPSIPDSRTSHNASSSASSTSSSKDSGAVEPTVLSHTNNEYGPTQIYLTIDATILRPTPGTVIEGHIRLQNENYIGLVCWNFFNAVIKRQRLPGDWRWVQGGAAEVGRGNELGGKSKSNGSAPGIDRDGDGEAERDEDEDVDEDADEDEDENNETANQSSKAVANDQETYMGHFVDARGKRVDELVRFKIKNYECAPSSEWERGFISLEGTLLDDEADRAVDEKVRAEFRAAGRERRRARL